ncbi:MAG: hypothetical protein L0G99_15820, partial [Propionibacteriales bacterium]|nr:hypothetical protein [Propionibacteriales bacterium]
MTTTRTPTQSRRHMLASTAALGGGILAAGGTGCAAASAESPSPSFVLVHGSASNAYFWTPLVRELALLGRR